MIDLSIILLVNETRKENKPTGLYFNACHVCLGAYKIEILNKNRHKVEFRFACVNGMWGGSISVDGPSYGMACPLSHGDFKFHTLSDCLVYMKMKADAYIRGQRYPEFKETNTFNRQFEEFFALTEDEQLKRCHI